MTRFQSFLFLHSPALPSLAAAALTWGLTALAEPAHATEPPAELFEAAEQALAACGVQDPDAERILDGYLIETDLNGDGVPDFITDPGGIACGAGVQADCGAGGCAMTAWLSRPDGNYRAFGLGPATGAQILPAAAANGLPVLRVVHGPGVCATAGLDDPTCTRDWVFDRDPPEPPLFRTGASSRPAIRPDTPLPPSNAPDDAATRPAARPGHIAALAAAQPGWTLRKVPDASPVALGVGPDNLLSLGAFCLQDAPFLALRFRDPPDRPELTMAFNFRSGRVETQALREETAGGAFIIDLTATPLARRLAGVDREVPIEIDGVPAGILSLEGSTVSLRTALRACYSF